LAITCRPRASLDIFARLGFFIAEGEKKMERTQTVTDLMDTTLMDKGTIAGTIAGKTVQCGVCSQRRHSPNHPRHYS
jgi:hypothetical protein